MGEQQQTTDCGTALLPAPSQELSDLMKHVLVVETKGALLRKISARNTWMGYGLDGRSDSTTLPVDVLHFLLWAQQYAQQENGRHLAVIADDLATYNCNNLAEVRERGQRLKSVLEKAVTQHDLDRIDVRVWRELAEDQAYPDLRSNLSTLARTERILGDNILETVPGYDKRCARMPEEREQWMRRAAYSIEEIAMTIHLARTGFPIKLGHEKERTYDKRTIFIGDNKRLRSCLGLDNEAPRPAFVYLRGGYETDATSPDRIVPPYLLGYSSRNGRVLLSDSPDAVQAKVEQSSQTYRGWCVQLLGLLGHNGVSPDDKGEIARRLSRYALGNK